MGFVPVGEAGHDNPTIEEEAPEATVVEEEPEIEEIVRPKEETVAPQLICVTRRRHGEWVVHEEEHSDRATCKLQCTIEDLMKQIKVRTPKSYLADVSRVAS